jgi:hypothetical protein
MINLSRKIALILFLFSAKSFSLDLEKNYVEKNSEKNEQSSLTLLNLHSRMFYVFSCYPIDDFTENKMERINLALRGFPGYKLLKFDKYDLLTYAYDNSFNLIQNNAAYSHKNNIYKWSEKFASFQFKFSNREKTNLYSQISTSSSIIKSECVLLDSVY